MTTWTACTPEFFFEHIGELDIKQYPDMEWKTHPQFENYIISNYGDVVSLKNSFPKVRKTYQDRTGYYQVYLWNNGEQKAMSIHRLVAQLFVDNPENLPCIDHISNNHVDNYYKNLQWISNADNVRKNHATGYSTKKKRVYDETDDCFYESIAACARALGCSPSNARHDLESGHKCKNHIIRYV